MKSSLCDARVRSRFRNYLMKEVYDMRLTLTRGATLTACLVALAAACSNTPTNTNTAIRTANTNTAVAPQGTPAAAPTTAAAQSDIPHPEIERISVEESRDLHAKNGAVFVDTRSASAYETAHVKGALNITGGDLDAKLKSLPRDKKIITYCT